MESLVFGLSIVQVILCVFLIVIVVMQQSQNRGLSGAISGNTDTFYGKNKSRSKESRLSKATIISMVLLVVVTLAINIIG